jgi:hypothetical protein
MDKTEIIEMLENGEYTVEFDSCCDCSVEDITGEYGIEYAGNECWQSNSITIDGVLVAEFISHEGYDPNNSCLLTYDELEDAIGYKGIVAMQFADNHDNHDHDDYQQMVIDFCEGKQWDYYRKDSNFANVFDLLLIKNGKKLSELNGDYSEYEVITLEDFAYDVTNEGDDATDIYSSLDVIE